VYRHFAGLVHGICDGRSHELAALSVQQVEGPASVAKAVAPGREVTVTPLSSPLRPVYCWSTSCVDDEAHVRSNPTHCDQAPRRDRFRAYGQRARQQHHAELSIITICYSRTRTRLQLAAMCLQV
jgi:hypothetical protein